jgi:hypothetical protein
MNDEGSRHVLLARLVTDGPPAAFAMAGEDNFAALERLLLGAFATWSPSHTAEFLVTAGGFITADWPRNLSGRSSWNSSRGDFVRLAQKAEEAVERVVTPRVLRAARGKVRYLTLGVDSRSGDARFGAEMVAVYEIGESRVRGWTGKSYPTPR